MTSNASGSWGCGAYSGKEWFMLPWVSPHSTLPHYSQRTGANCSSSSIMGQVMERQACWGAVRQLSSGDIISQGTEAIHLMRCLVHLASRGEFLLQAVHVRGSDNVLADAISQNNVALFHSLHPQARPATGGSTRRTAGCAVPAGPRLDIQKLDRSVELYFRNGLANSTHTKTTTYASGKRRYIQFCHSNNFPPLPTSELLLKSFYLSPSQ